MTRSNLHPRLITFITLIVVATASTAADRKPITHESLWMMKRVGSPAVSPDGKLVIVDVQEPAYDDKNEVSDLWIMPSDGTSTPRRLTATKGGESDAAWSPDSRRIAFVARRDGDEVNQIYILDLGGGDPIRITSLPLAPRSPRWSPDGKSVAFQMSAYPGTTDEASNKKAAEAEKNQKYNVRVYTSFPIRRWDRWLDNTQTHLWVVPSDGGASRDLLAGSKLVAAHGFSGGGGSGSRDSLDPAWTPDGRSLIIVATTDSDRSAISSVSTSLYQVSLSGGEPKKLTSGTTSYSSPAFAPNGSLLCFDQSNDYGKIYALDDIGCSPWPAANVTETTRTLTAGFDRSVGEFALTADSSSVYFTAEDSGLVKLYSVAASGGKVSEAIGPKTGVYSGLSIPAKSSSPILIANWGSAINPTEVVRIDPAMGSHRLLTQFDVAEAEKIDWAPLQHFTFTASSGRKVHSMIALPPNFDPRKKYPLFVLIHGGAANMWRDQISYRWNYHLLAKPGFVVLATDYRGSTGYGEQFSLDILHDPLKGPAQDINDAADEAIRRFSYIDRSRQCAGGASYGGHLTNWLEATNDGRYKCLVSHAGLSSLQTQWGTSDGNYHRELEIGGPAWEGNPLWIDQSPMHYAGKFKTPILMSVGEHDFRVPMNNTLEMWAALQRMQVPSRLLIWPDANHWILKAEDSRVFYSEVAEWLKKYLQ
ncbi:MAG: S9 family peptidase [Acidobacteriota bacterium]